MRTELVAAFTVSILVHAAGISTVDRAVLDFERSFEVKQQRLKLVKKLGGTHFEFVEAPPQKALRPPVKNLRHSDRDSLASDLTAEKEKAVENAPPKIEREGPSDQLEQKRFDPSQAASPASTPSAPRPAVPEQAAPQTEQAQQSASMTLSPPAPQPRPAQPPSPASPAMAPKPAVQGLTGQDRITTQAVSRSRSHGAQLYGRTSFEATGSGMGRYMRELKEKIWLAWFPYLAFHYPKDFRSADAVITFTLDAQGQVKSVRAAQTEGSPVFAAFCVEAVQRAAPFGPLPPEILDLTGKDDLEVQFAFHFW